MENLSLKDRLRFKLESGRLNRLPTQNRKEIINNANAKLSEMEKNYKEIQVQAELQTRTSQS
jgi:hypothetical protein